MKMTEKSILTAYFSHSGNTRIVAEKIHETVGGDIFEIVSVDPYPQDYNAVVEQAKSELDRNYRPPLKTKVRDMDSYDLIFVGYPDWWSTIPMSVASFLSGYDLSGKTIAPFCTHGGSDLGRSVSEIRKLCPGSTVPDGLAIRAGNVKSSQKVIDNWLPEVGFRD